MPATPARIGFALEEWRKAVSEDSEVRARHGNLARESEDPIETFFDSVADAQAMANERQALLGTERRRFRIESGDMLEAIERLDFLSGTIPNVYFADARFKADGKLMIGEIGFEFDKQVFTTMGWG